LENFVGNYLFCCEHKRLTAEHFPVSFGKTLQARKLQQNTEEKSSAGRLFVTSLTFAFFSTMIMETLTGIFLLDLTATFFGPPNTVSIATTGQLVTLSSVVSVFFGVLLGVLTVKYNHKKLLLLGVLGITLGTVGCFFAPDFLFMQIFYSIEGIGTVIVNAMAFVLIGEFLVLNRRAKATGWVIAGAPMAGVASALVVNFFFSGLGGWRSFLLWFALPISLVALAAAFFGVPLSSQEPKVTVGNEAYLSSFKQVFLQKSGAACLVGNMFRQTAIGYGVVYSATFFRDKFGLSIGDAALFVLGVTALFALSSIIGGQLVNKVGRKRQLVATLVIATPALVLAAFVPNLWVAIALHYVFFFIFSLSNSPSVSLTLEQAPESRGTMMSMSGMFVTLGMLMGAAVGGVALVLAGWLGVLLTFAVLTLTSAAIYFFLTKDPCRK
jgi:DHA1 family putative efflux transporter-like MFS transporter